VARVVATIVAALVFAPIKDQFQIWLDKFFYRIAMESGTL